MIDRPIALIGLRATGKTTVGRLLALQLNVPFIDVDDDVERVARKSIAKIFADDGEPCFRDLEATAIADRLNGQPIVLATGGGAVMRESTRLLLKTQAHVVWLTASVDTMLARLHADPSTAGRRPSLTGLGPREEIERLCREREPLYREVATMIVPTDERTTVEIVNSIVNSLRAA